MGIVTILDSYEHRQAQWWRDIFRFIVQIARRMIAEEVTVRQTLEAEVEL